MNLILNETYAAQLSFSGDTSTPGPSYRTKSLQQNLKETFNCLIAIYGCDVFEITLNF